MFLLKKLLRVVFTKYFFDETEFLVLQRCVLWTIFPNTIFLQNLRENAHPKKSSWFDGFDEKTTFSFLDWSRRNLILGVHRPKFMVRHSRSLWRPTRKWRQMPTGRAYLVYLQMGNRSMDCRRRLRQKRRVWLRSYGRLWLEGLLSRL